MGREAAPSRQKGSFPCPHSFGPLREFLAWNMQEATLWH